MREIPLTQGKVAIVDDDMYDFLNQWNWCVNPSHGKDGKTCYAARGINEVNGKHRLILMHRVIMQTPVGMNTDHINGDGLDNRRENLRICTTLKNCQNRQKQRQTSSSVFKGVSWYPNRKKWVAYIKVNGIQLHLGYFTSEYNAAVCYNLAAKKYFGEFALTNLKLFKEKYGREIVEL